jgi:hypothetical protein
MQCWPFHDAFCVRCQAGESGHLPVHTDESTLVRLAMNDDFEGGAPTSTITTDNSATAGEMLSFPGDRRSTVGGFGKRHALHLGSLSVS